MERLKVFNKNFGKRSLGDVMNHLRISDIVRWDSFTEAYAISILNVDILQPHASLLKSAHKISVASFLI